MMRLVEGGWGVFPIPFGAKSPVIDHRGDDPGNRTGRCNWSLGARLKTATESWQRPLRAGGCHQSVFNDLDAAQEMWTLQAGAPIVGVTSARCVCLDVDAPGRLPDDPELLEAVRAMLRIGCVVVLTAGGGRHLIARWHGGKQLCLTNGVPKPDGSAWGPGRRIADVKLCRGSYIVAPGQAIKVKGGERVRYRLCGPDLRPTSDPEDTLPPVAEVPEMSAALSAQVAACRNRKPPPPPPRPKPERRAFAPTAPRSVAEIRQGRVAARAAARGAAGVVLLTTGAGDGSWVDRAVERDGMAGAHRGRNDGCYDYLVKLTGAAGFNGYLAGAADAKLRALCIRFGYSDADYDRMTARFR